MEINLRLEDLSKILYVVLIISIVITAIVVQYKLLNKFNEPITLEYKYNNQVEKGETVDFLIMAKRFAANHQYTNSYNCKNYTRDMYNIASALGFKTQIIGGCPNKTAINNNECHLWLRLSVDFEPQKGEFVDFSKQFPLQEEKEVEKIR